MVALPQHTQIAAPLSLQKPYSYHISMAIKTTTLALFLAINVLFFALASACGTCPPVTKPPVPKPKPVPTPTPSSSGSCPIDTLKLSVCANVLQGLLNVVIGTPPSQPCCSLISGLVDLDAAVCLCTAIKANVLGINLNALVDLTLLLNHCGKQCPSDFQCA